MNAIRLVYDAVPDSLPVPPSMRRRHVEVVFLALDEELAPNQDEAARTDSPGEILEPTAVALAELPEPEHQGRSATRVPGSARGRLTIIEDDEDHLNDFAQYMP
jgi:hypothetical protein